MNTHKLAERNRVCVCLCACVRERGRESVCEHETSQSKMF